MNNADMPAMPQEADLLADRIGLCPTVGMGITKREMFAMHAMQGFASTDIETTKLYLNSTGEDDIGVMFAKMSVEFADALLAELDKCKS